MTPRKIHGVMWSSGDDIEKIWSDVELGDDVDMDSGYDKEMESDDDIEKIWRYVESSDDMEKIWGDME